MKKKTLEEFIEKSILKYGKIYDYSLAIYNNSNKPITLICPNNHIFNINPSTHLSKNSKGGCKECYVKNLNHNRKNKYNQDTIVDYANKIHNYKYNYNNVIYKSLHEYIIIICKIHGEFSQTPFTHIFSKCGCPQCGKIKCKKSRMLNEEQIKLKLEKFKNIHNNKYEYGTIVRKEGILWLEIICPKHGSHITRFFNHEKGHGCPKCVSNKSYIQIQWLEYRMISDGFIQHADNIGEYVIPNTKLYVDGYNKKTNTVYEFQGDFWHGNPEIYDLDTINKKLNVSFRELYNNTIDKLDKISNMGYNVVYIWENNWRKGITAIKRIQKLWKTYYALNPPFIHSATLRVSEL